MNEKRLKIKHAMKKVRNILLTVIVLGLILFFAIRFYYPYGEGVKTGQLNFVVYKGIVFKTYEGKLIQTGFSSGASGGIHSNEFNFSIADPKIAEELMRAGGQIVDLHYKEYFAAIPWRGYSRYIVDDIISIKSVESAPMQTLPPVTE